MDIDDLFDELDDRPQFSEMDSIISKQCIAIHSGDTYIGSGVLLNWDGVFITVAHNFKNASLPYNAFFAGRDYTIELIFAEYDVETCKDFYVGRLKDFEQNQVDRTKLVGFSAIHGPHLKVCGYKSKWINCPLITEDIHITDNLYVNQYVTQTNLITKENWLNLPGRRVSPRAKDDKCNYIDINTDKFKGLSGGPVYSENGLHGLLVGDVFLLSQYVIAILSKFQIQYNSVE